MTFSILIVSETLLNLSVIFLVMSVLFLLISILTGFVMMKKLKRTGYVDQTHSFFIRRYFIQYRCWNLRNLEKLILRINPRLKIWKGCNFVCWKSVSTIQLYVFNVFLSNLLTEKLTNLTMIDTPNIYIYSKKEMSRAIIQEWYKHIFSLK